MSCLTSVKKEVWTDYHWKDYQTVHEEATQIARAIQGKELFAKVTEKGVSYNFIGLYSKNNKEWVTTDCAAILGAFTTVTLYDTLGETASEHIINECELKTIFTTPDLVHHLIHLKSEDQIDTLEYVVTFGDPNDSDVEKAEDCGIEILTLESLMDYGKS